MDTLCWTVAIVVILVLAYFGCTEMSRTPHSASARRAQPAPVKSAKNVVNDSSDAPREPLTQLDTHHFKNPANLDKAFRKVDVDPSMERVVNTDSSNIGSEFFMQLFHDDDSTSFRPINREQARASANIRPAQQMQNGRADGGPPARQIGLSPMEFARKTIQRPVANSGCIAFNDTDHRSTLVRS